MKKQLKITKKSGFTKFTGPLQYWTDLKYMVDKCAQLQLIAESLIE